MINTSVIRTHCWNKNVSKYRNSFKFTYSIQTFMSTTLLFPKTENKNVCEKLIPNDYTWFLCSLNFMIIQSTVIRKIVSSMFGRKKIVVGTSLLSNLHLIVLKNSNLILFYLKKDKSIELESLYFKNQIKSKIVLHFYHVICKII